MYSLAAYNTSPVAGVPEDQMRHPTSSTASRLVNLRFSNLRDSFRRTKSKDRITTAESGSPTIEAYRKSIKSRNKTSTTTPSSTSISGSSNSGNSLSSKSISSKSSNSKFSSSKSMSNKSIRSSNIDSMNSITSCISNGNIKTVKIKDKTYIIHKIVLDPNTATLDTSVSSADEDEDLYDFDLYEDERRYRPILKRTSKYGPLPVSNSQKPKGFWWLFGSYKKPLVSGDAPLGGGGVSSSLFCSAGSPKLKHQVNEWDKLVLGNPRLKHHQDPSSDQGYSSDDGSSSDKDIERLPQPFEKPEKNRVIFSEPLVTHVYRLTYKSYLPKDAAIVTLKV